VKVVDRVGAGDSLLAISSLCMARDWPLDIAGFVANMVGAQAVRIVGNRSSVRRDLLLQGIESILR
jgi:sugar/nucleoside kinase (ribokinase family)